MMTKSIRNRMYGNVGMLIFFLVTAIAVTVAGRARAAGLPKDKAPVNKAEPGT